MRDRHDEAVEVAHLTQGDELHAVGAPGVGGVSPRVADDGVDAVLPEPLEDVLHLGVAHVRAVLLEGDAEHADLGLRRREAREHHLLDGGVRDELAHAVVDLAAGEDDLGVVAELLGLVGEVVGVHADAVPAHEAGSEAESVPLGVHSVHDLGGVDAHAVEHHRELVHEGDVDVALRVLHDLDRLGGLDGRDGVGPRRDDDVVDPPDLLEGLLVHAGDDLAYGRESVHAVAGVDALGAVADLEVDAAPEARLLLEDGHAHVLGDAGVDRGLVHDDGARPEVTPQGARGALDGGEVGRLVLVHRRWHGDDVEPGLLEPRRVARELDRRRGHSLVSHLVGGVDARPVLLDLGLVDVEPDDGHVFCKLDCDGHAHVAEADEGQLCLSVKEVLIKAHVPNSSLFLKPRGTAARTGSRRNTER